MTTEELARRINLVSRKVEALIDSAVLNRLSIGNSAHVSSILDEDDLVSDLHTALATQQSIKAYVDSATSCPVTFYQTEDDTGLKIYGYDDRVTSYISLYISDTETSHLSSNAEMYITVLGGGIHLQTDAMNDISLSPLYGTVKLGNTVLSGDLSLGDNKITNVGDIALDSISADGGSTFLITGYPVIRSAGPKLYFEDTDESATLGNKGIRISADGLSGAGLTFTYYTSAPYETEMVRMLFTGVDIKVPLTISGGMGADISFGDNDITNVGDIALDSISADGSTIVINDYTRLNEQADSQGFVIYGYDDQSGAFLHSYVDSNGKGTVQASGTLRLMAAVDIQNKLSTGGKLAILNNAWDNVFTVKETGKVGIGDSTPTASLEVHETDADTASFIFKAVGSYGALKNIMYHREDNESLVINEDAVDLDFRVEGTGSAYLLYTDAGNDRVGIGGIPNQLLTVGGIMSLKEVASSGSDVAGYGQLWAKAAPGGTPTTVLCWTDDSGQEWTVDLTAA